MEEDQKNQIKEFFKFLRENKNFILSHHPICPKFENDYYQLSRIRLCIGCFTAYPIALAIILAWSLGFLNISMNSSFMIGLSSGSVQFLSLTVVSKNKLGKISIKVFLGIGIGFFTIGIFSLPLIFSLRILLFLLCINIAGLFSFLRMRKIKKICVKCRFNKEWSICPGFKQE